MLAHMGFTRDDARKAPDPRAVAAVGLRIDIVEMAKNRRETDGLARPPEARKENLRVDIVAEMRKRFEDRRPAR
ncbi:hypothetical protein LUX29_21500 [Aureimonas altamirensis]|uniref:hypothetical protein n=1 Tax=Aureimonas altamirensis TaxID=370622 RepID=UPI001E49FAEC|nr:hypothetical protein [Aureimonas altamirensis]UHD45531.1 hypothetical protein LUX29_21500 [Aureimonas altamirensis]